MIVSSATRVAEVLFTVGQCRGILDASGPRRSARAGFRVPKPFRGVASGMAIGRGRTLGQLGDEEGHEVIAAIHAEAVVAGWHTLSPARTSALYAKWQGQYDLSHQSVKDRIMKGFDTAQHIPPSGEAAIHAEVLELLRQSPLPYVESKVRRKDWRREVDFVWGFSDRFLTHIAELEPATTWETGLSQSLLYKNHYYQGRRIQTLPTLILFGDVTAPRWDPISTVCADQRVLLLSYDLRMDGDPVGDDLTELLA